MNFDWWKADKSSTAAAATDIVSGIIAYSNSRMRARRFEMSAKQAITNTKLQKVALRDEMLDGLNAMSVNAWTSGFMGNVSARNPAQASIARAKADEFHLDLQGRATAAALRLQAATAKAEGSLGLLQGFMKSGQSIASGWQG